MTPVAAEVSLAFSGEGAEEVTASMTTQAAAKPKEATCAMPPSTSSATTIKPPPPPKPSPSSRHARLVVLAGPCGSGKTTVGRALSRLLGGGSAGTSSAAAAAVVGGVPFLDADDYHDAAAKEKMSAGRPLDDGDRLPWLARVAAASRDAAAFSPSHVAVLACSALKKKYRELLVEVANEGAAVPSVHVDFVLLRARKESLRARLQERQERASGAAEEVAGHFLHPSLLESQLEAWEDSEEVVVVENDGEGAGGEGGGGAEAAAARTAEAVLLAVGLDGGGKQ